MRKPGILMVSLLLLATFGVGNLIGASAAQAASTTKTSSFSLSGSTGEQTLQGLRVLCDDCAPDSLFDCGDGCEIAGGLQVSLTSAVQWEAPFDVATTTDPDTFHQGSTAPLTDTATAKAGTLKLTYALHYTIGIFGRGGDFPSDDWHPSTDTITGSVTKTAEAPCTAPLTGGSNGTCSADIELPFFDECFLTGCPVEVTVSLIVKNTVTIGAGGLIVHREATFQTPRNLTLGSSSVNDPLTIPCTANVGDNVDYTLSNPSYGPVPVVATGSLALGVFIDGPGPANLEDDFDLPISGKVFDGTISLSSSEASGNVLGQVLADNIAPTLNATIPSGPYTENNAETVTGLATDNCNVGVSIDWGEGTVDSFGGTSTSQAISRSHTYGDNGTFPIRVCAADAYVSTCKNGSVVFTNVDPTAAIGTAGATTFNGQQAFFAHAGQPIDLTGRSTDPGSDDLTLTWDWGDGAPSPDVTVVSLVNPPLADLPASPSVQPRDETNTQTHTFGQACLYTITFGSRDDDGGTGSATAKVVIVGNASRIRSAGYWQTNMVGKGTKEFSATRLNCYLATVAFLSSVFNEKVDASTIAKAAALLKLGSDNNASPTAQFDRQLLAAWLNFANGSIALDQLVDTNGDGTLDAKFGDVLLAAEAVRLNPASTSTQLLQQKSILERVNMSMGG